MEKITPREMLDAMAPDEIIEEQIAEVSIELEVLKLMLKIAKKAKGDSGNSGPRKKQAGPKQDFDEAKELVLSALSAGPLSLRDLSESTGVSFAYLRVNMKKIPGIQKTTGGEWEIQTGKN